MLKNVGLRVYEKFSPQYYLYEEMHKHQTLEYVKLKREQYSNLNNKKMKIKDALIALDTFVDPSDPDVDVPNCLVHCISPLELYFKRKMSSSPRFV